MVLSPYKHEPLNQFGEDLTPEQEQSTKDYWTRVHADRTPEQNVTAQNRLKQAREAKFGADNTPEQQQKVGDYWKNEPRELNNPGSQRAAAGRLKQLTRQRQATFKQASKIQTAKGLAEKYKQIRNILRIAKVGTGITVAGLILTVLMAHAEWIYHKFNKNYPFTKLDKILTLAADAIILLALVIILSIIYITQILPGQLLLEYIGL